MQLTLIHPPYAEQSDLFGVRVAGLLSRTGKSGYSHFYVASAFVRLSGVGRIATEVAAFRKRGGLSTLVAGVDMRGTTLQGLSESTNVFDNVFIYNDADPSRTFHPKLFVLKNTRAATVFIGSNNLTMGGLYANYELAVLVDLDLSMRPDIDFLRDVDELYASYSSGRGNSKKLTNSLLLELVDQGKLADETRPDPRPNLANSGRRSSGARVRNTYAAPPNLPAHYAAMLRRKLPPTLRPSPSSASPASHKMTIPGQAAKFWKRLSNNDVSLTSSPGQIIIPKAYVSNFPPLLPTANQYLNESTLATEFIAADGTSIPAPDSRLILYIPKPNQPRPNIEYRFTFRDRDILTMLSADDVLVFEPQPAPYHFRVWQVQNGSAASKSFVGRDGVIA